MSDLIPLSVPCIQGNEWKYIKDCLDTEWVSSAGKYVDLFEQKICEFTGAKYAVACVNGTAALHISLLISGVKPEDEVIVPTLTFISPINVVRYCNANPVFMDCDDYYNIDVEKTIQFIHEETIYKNGYTYNKKTGKRIPAILPVHVFGNAVNLEPLENKCRERNIKIVEDATESLGTYYKEGKLKNKYTGTIGDVGCYSFNGNKIITTGGGGIIVTNDKKLADKARYLTTQAKDDPIRYIHNEIGFNYRLSNIQAAMGIAQLEMMPKFLTIKKENYHYYKEKIDNINGLFLTDVPSIASNNYWMYTLQIDENIYKGNRDDLMIYLKKNKIETRPIWHLNHLQKQFKMSYAYMIYKAPEMYRISLNLPCSVKLNKKEIEQIMRLLKKKCL